MVQISALAPELAGRLELAANTGTTLSVVLANGTHTIGLISQDSDGRLDATALQYTRTCI